jgi:gliding motility-associated-like protein
LTGAITTFRTPTVPIVYDFVLNASGSLLYATSAGTNQVYVLETSAMTTKAIINLGPPGPGSIDVMALSPDGSTLYAPDIKNGNLYVISTATNTVVNTIPVNSPNDNSYGIAVSPDGSIVYVTDPLANAVKVLSTSTYTVIATIPVAAGPSYILLSPDGSRLYVSDEPSKQVTVINTSTNSIVATISVGSKPISLGLVPDGTQLYVLNILGSSISVINTATNTVINTIHLHSSPDAWGTFIASPCGIGPITHTITVNPSPFITPSAISGSIAACAGATSASPAIQTFAVSGSYLTGDITATASTGFEVSLDPISGYAHTATIAQSGGAVNAIPIYIRSSAAVQQGNTTGSITLSTTGGTDQQVAVAATITAQPTITFPADSVVEGNTGIQLTPTVTGNIATYDWSPTDGLSAADIPNPVANPSDPITYQLRVTTDNGCTADGKITVIIHRPLLMATAFTPNGDGHNDLFRIPPGANLVLEQFTVFNRWGFEVFSTNNAAAGWDGTTQGSPAPSGVYVYVIKGKDGTGRSITLKGTVALIR